MDDLSQALAQASLDLRAVELDGDRQSADQVTSAHLHHFRRAAFPCRSDLLLDFLCRAITDQQLLLFLTELDDLAVHRISGHLQRAAGDDLAIGGSSADVQHHASARPSDIQTGADRGHLRLFLDVYLLRAAAVCRVADRIALYAGDVARAADQDDRPLEHAFELQLLEEIVQHDLGHFKVRDDAVLQRADRQHPAGRPSQHFFCLASRRQAFLRFRIYRNDAGLIDDDALAFHVHQ